jgi:hypothetical protein
MGNLSMMSGSPKRGNLFFMKIQKQSNLCNGNGYINWVLYWAFFKKRGCIRLYVQRIGTGDSGERCKIN